MAKKGTSRFRPRPADEDQRETSLRLVLVDGPLFIESLSPAAVDGVSSARLQ